MSILSNDPLKWASLCKDYNFIHLSGFAARLFGLPGKLAHGNHVVAKAMHVLEGVGHKTQDMTWMEIQFRRPVAVPTSLNVDLQSTSADVKRIFIGCGGRKNIVVDYGTLNAPQPSNR
jgi:acyl dehydratase